jgi:hypothetical protein
VTIRHHHASNFELSRLQGENNQQNPNHRIPGFIGPFRAGGQFDGHGGTAFQDAGIRRVTDRAANWVEKQHVVAVDHLLVSQDPAAAQLG